MFCGSGLPLARYALLLRSAGTEKRSGKRATLLPLPPLRTGRDGFPIIRLKPW